jgi:hypothetical protein
MKSNIEATMNEMKSAVDFFKAYLN